MSSQQTASRATPSSLLVYSTVRIECADATGVGTGTGFFFSFCRTNGKHVPAIVTNKHVVRHAVRGSFYIHLRDDNGEPLLASSARFEIESFESRWTMHPDPAIDLCAMPVGALYEKAERSGRPIYFMPLEMALVPSGEEFLNYCPLEEIVMVGYPNGIWDDRNNMPVLRRGITATHPGLDYEGRKEFLIDAACFPGSSGSPVVLYNTGGYLSSNGNFYMGTRVKLLGVLYAGQVQKIDGQIVSEPIPTGRGLRAESHIPINLGNVIRSSELKFFEDHFATTGGE